MRNNGSITTFVMDPARDRERPGSGGRKRQRVAAFLVAITVAAGCSSTESPAATDAPRAAEPTPTTVPATPTTQPATPTTSTNEPESNGLDRVLLSDDFDSDLNGWGGRFQSFENGAYVWSLPPGQSDARAADALIAIEDRLTQHSTTIEFTAPHAAAVAIECAWEEIEASSRWYSLELSVDGAAIRKRPPGNDPSVDLASTDEVTLTDRPTTLEAICVRTADEYRLSLVVDGRTVLDAVDTDPYGPGAPNIAVRAATDESADEITATFDRFEIRVPDDGPTLPTAATPGPTPSPDSSIIDPAVVAEALQSQLDALVEATGVPGATAGIRVPGFDDLLISSGVANTTTGEAISTDEVFRIGSVTKTFTAAIVLSLVEDGRLSLDDTLDAWYPDVPNAERITIEQLLEHRAGTTDFAPGEEQSLLLGDLEHSYTIDEVVALTSDRPATLEPGEGEGYSNMNYRLLGGVIEKVTGQPVAVELEDRITGPLALANTLLDDGSGPAPGHGYFSIDQGVSYLDVVDFPNRAAMTMASTAGGIDSTLPDLLSWATALYGGDLLGADATSSMVDSVDDGWHESVDSVIGLGVIGFCPCRDDAPWEPVFIGHDGGFVGSATLLVFQPATGLAMVFHANRDADLELINGFLDIARSAAALIVTDAEAP